MSVELWVFFERRRLPSVEAWSRALAALDVPFRLPADLDLEAASGHVVLGPESDEPVGFELYIDALDAEARALIEQVPGAGALDRVATLRIGPDEDALLAASAAAVALVRVSGGLLIDDHDDEKVPMPPDRALAWLAQVRADLEPAAPAASEPPEPAPPKETAAAWKARCLPLARAVHADYAVNKAQKGASIEYLRQLSNGLWASHNFDYRRDSIKQGFAVMFTPTPTRGRLLSPLTIGGRFDHGFTVSDAFSHHLGIERPTGVHSNYGGWRTNTFELVALCMQNAERQLLPAYVARLAEARERFVRLLERAQALVELLARGGPLGRAPVAADPFLAVYQEKCPWAEGDPARWDEEYRRDYDIRIRLRAEGIDPLPVLEHRTETMNLTANEIAVGSEELERIPPALRDTCIAVNNADLFLAIAAELPTLVETARRLRA